MATTRIKAKQTLIPIADWAAADEMVRQIGDWRTEITLHQDDARKMIEDVKANLAATAKVLTEKIDRYTESLQAFAVAHQEDFGAARSRKLNHGVLGWRKSTAMRLCKGTLEAIKQVFSPAKAKCLIRVKEEVDKEALDKLSDEQLAAVGARRDVRDAFYVEPATVEAR